jgi:hypothetical protein
MTLKINVLGVEYTIDERTEQEDECLKDRDGYCDHTTRECVVDAFEKTDINSLKNIEEYKQSVKRHEIIHAFLHESGLGSQSWGANEEMVDWWAIQFPKIMQAFLDAGCI